MQLQTKRRETKSVLFCNPRKSFLNIGKENIPSFLKCMHKNPEIKWQGQGVEFPPKV